MNYGYDYSYDVSSTVATGFGAALGILAFIWIICLAVCIFTIVCNWKVFKKAGKNGWEAIIPIYNIVVLLKITKLPLWYLLLFFIPFVNFVALILIYIELAKKFGQSTLFGIGLAFFTPIFMAILAFNKNYVYQIEPTLGENTTVTYANENNQSAESTVNTIEQPVQQTEQVVQPAPTIHPNNCPGCGAPVDADDRFCMYCGKQL